MLDPRTSLLQKPFTPDALTRRVGDVLGACASVGPAAIRIAA